jgi:hypothetical protein
VAKWLTRWSAKPVFAGSIPARCSIKSMIYIDISSLATPSNTILRCTVLKFPSRTTMRINRIRYQQGSIRKVRRATGFAWEFRFYVNEGGKRCAQSHA